MSNIMPTIKAIERRARTVRAFRAAAVYFCVALIPLVVSFVLERGHVVSLPDVIWLMLAVFPVVVFAATFFVARRLPINMSQVLLRVDLCLGTGERLSSIHELYRRNELGPYRDLLEEGLRMKTLHWNRHFRLGGSVYWYLPGLPSWQRCLSHHL